MKVFVAATLLAVMLFTEFAAARETQLPTAPARNAAPASGESGAQPGWRGDEKRTDENGHVVHTKLGPVLMHRAFPPYLGVHTYERPNRSRRGK